MLKAPFNHKVQTIVTISSIIIAIVSVIIGYSSYSISSRSAGAAVMPLLQFEHTWNKDIIEISIKNQGLGPAIINSYVIKKKGEVLYSKNSDIVDISFMLSGLKDGRKVPTIFYVFHKGDSLPIGASKTLIKFTLNDKLDPDVKRNIRDFMLHVQLTVKYCSLMDNCKTVENIYTP